MTQAQQIEITPEMIAAGVDVLAGWKSESDYVSERQAVREIFEAMFSTAMQSRKTLVPQSSNGWQQVNV